MIIDEFALTNFGVYRGEHRIMLTPPSTKRPIVLFGGLNGTGKTTLLDALQLVLYGKRARCSNRGSKAYDEFLLSCINRRVSPADGASLELQFRHQTEGAEHVFRVRRTWRANGSGVKENVEVFLNGSYDPAASQSWAEYAEDFIPSRLSDLFFFDGEKIEALADLDNASVLLRTAVHSLLGLDIVDRLDSDLLTLISRKEREFDPPESLKQSISELTAEVEALEERASTLFQEVSSVGTRLEQTKYRLRKVQERLQHEGGELFREKDLIISSKRDLELQLESLDNALRELAGGPAPILLVPHLLDSVARQAQAEKRGVQAQLLADVLEERDAKLLGVIHSVGLNPDQLSIVRGFLESDRESRGTAAVADRYLALSDESYGLLQELRISTLPAVREKVAVLLQRRRDVTHHLAVVERKLKTIPDEDAIKPFLDEVSDLERQYDVLERERRRLEEEWKQVNHQKERKQAELARIRRQAVELELEAAEAARIAEYSRATRPILRAFRQRVVEKHIETIQRSVLESFRQLIRKRHLVADIAIDAETFEVKLKAEDGATVLPERLSAGERQLLAVSLLWGLAKASRRPLPAVVDTPLGRLDSSHRDYLVRRYFPKASHQVLLLSTDEEIRGHYLDVLAPAIGHLYLLEFDEEDQTTRVKKGYFDREGIHAA
jgi:DNA sulfur modification protein DndD